MDGWVERPCHHSIRSGINEEYKTPSSMQHTLLGLLHFYLRGFATAGSAEVNFKAIWQLSPSGRLLSIGFYCNLPLN